MISKYIWEKLNVGTAIAAASFMLNFAAQRSHAQLLPLVEWTFDGTLASNTIDPVAVSSASSISLLGSATHFNDGNGSPLTPLAGSTNTSLGYIFTPGPGNGFSSSVSFGTVQLSDTLSFYFDINTFGAGMSDFIVSGTYNGGIPFSSSSVTPVVVPTSGPPEWSRVLIAFTSIGIPSVTGISDITFDIVANTSGVVSRIDGAGILIPEPSVTFGFVTLALISASLVLRKRRSQIQMST